MCEIDRMVGREGTRVTGEGNRENQSKYIGFQDTVQYTPTLRRTTREKVKKKNMKILNHPLYNEGFT